MPVPECPSDFIELFLTIMNDYSEMSKIGFSLKIDDIPDEYDKKDEVISWESQYYAHEVEAGGV